MDLASSKPCIYYISFELPDTARQAFRRNSILVAKAEGGPTLNGRGTRSTAKWCNLIYPDMSPRAQADERLKGHQGEPLA